MTRDRYEWATWCAGANCPQSRLTGRPALCLGLTRETQAGPLQKYSFRLGRGIQDGEQSDDLGWWY